MVINVNGIAISKGRMFGKGKRSNNKKRKHRTSKQTNKQTKKTRSKLNYKQLILTRNLFLFFLREKAKKKRSHRAIIGFSYRKCTCLHFTRARDSLEFLPLKIEIRSSFLSSPVCLSILCCFVLSLAKRCVALFVFP